MHNSHAIVRPHTPRNRLRGVLLTLTILAGLGLVAATAVRQGPPPQNQPVEWLPLGQKALSPAIFSKKGIGTAHAVVQARVRPEDARGYCENWSPNDVENCVRAELSPHEGKIYRASADCVAGRITAVDGETYTLAGVWTSDVGRGRSRWRDKTGNIVGQDNASNGLGIAMQWEILCTQGQVRAPAATKSPPRKKSAGDSR